MRVFLLGGSGAIGRRLVPQLIEAGHEVVATTRSEAKAAEVSALGATAAVVDALDRPAVISAVSRATPDVVIHQATALSGSMDTKHWDRYFTRTNRLRTDGVDILLEAARVAAVPRVIVQSFTGWTNERAGSPIKDETDPLDPNPVNSSRETLAAIGHLEAATISADDLTGIVLRYGLLYGPGTSIAADGEIPEMLRRRRLPVVGGGHGVWSFLHVDDAARATVAALEEGSRGLYNIVDDEPVPVHSWLPYLADAIGAHAPMRLPRWLARPMIGEFGVALMTSIHGSANGKAAQELGWHPTISSWRQGFGENL